jgi:hypothetical protein
VELQHLNIKFFLKNQDFAIEDCVPFFHEWIRKKLTDDLLIDVVDYSHIARGPGILLIGHNVSYSVDTSIGGRTGFLFNQKTQIEAPAFQVFLASMRAALLGCSLFSQNLEQEILAGESIFIVNDRLLAPNNSRSFQQLLEQIEPEAKKVLPLKSIEYIEEDERRRLSFRALFSANHISELLGAVTV